MKTKRIVGLVSLAVILIAGLYGVIYLFTNIPITYDGSDTDVVKLYEDYTNYDTSDPDGAADIIVKTNLEKTNAENAVAAIVFDYRGFDTIGESFILLAAISGSFVILHKAKKKKGGADNEVKE